MSEVLIIVGRVGQASSEHLAEFCSPGEREKEERMNGKLKTKDERAAD